MVPVWYKTQLLSFYSILVIIYLFIYLYICLIKVKLKHS